MNFTSTQSEVIHAYYCKLSQKNMVREVVAPRQEFTTIV